MLALTGRDVQDLVPMSTAVELMKTVFHDLSMGKTTSPLRTPVDVPESDGVSLFMPAYVPSIEGLGMKVVSVFPRNREIGKADHQRHRRSARRKDTGEPVANGWNIPDGASNRSGGRRSEPISLLGRTAR
jgi:ornithine cyclodeaminase/alanine dehydrogenase-like protein (mu-crystallin family)